jgi:hypothetical protein
VRGVWGSGGVAWAAHSFVCFVCLVCLVCLSACAPTELSLNGSAPDYGLPSVGGASSGPAVWTDAPLATGELPDLGGVWRLTQVTTIQMTLPVVQTEMVTTITSRLSVVIRQEGSELWLSARTCSVQMANEPNLGQRLISQAFIDSMPPLHRRARLLRGEGGELLFEAPRAYVVSGAWLEDPASGSLPASPEDPRVVDGDRDGLPGLTVRLTGFPAGDIYIAQRTWDILRGEVLSAGRVEGQLEWAEERVTLGATAEILLVEVPSVIVDDPALQRFTLERVSGEPEGVCAWAPVEGVGDGGEGEVD